MYYSLIRSLGTETPMAHDTSVEKHSDFSWESDDGSGTKMSFLWAPLAGDVASRVRDRGGGWGRGGSWYVVHPIVIRSWPCATCLLDDTGRGAGGRDDFITVLFLT